ncbi:hypothetical protein CLBKND_00091 [Methylorubrum aminovorans]
MPISRMDFADAGSPEALVKRILQAEPNLPLPVPIKELCARLGILRIKNLNADEFEGGLVTDAKRSEGTILAKRGGEPRRRFTIAHELGHFLMAHHVSDQLVDEAILREWLMNVGRRSAVERLAHLFCELLLRLKVVGLAEGTGYKFPLTQVDLADTTGITSVHVNRSLRELRQSGLIELEGGRLKILDYAGLRALAEFRANYLHLADCAAA